MVDLFLLQLLAWWKTFVLLQMFVTLKVVDLGIAMCYKFCSSIKENRQLLLVSFVGLTKVLIGQSHKKGGQGLGMSAPN